MPYDHQECMLLLRWFDQFLVKSVPGLTMKRVQTLKIETDGFSESGPGANFFGRFVAFGLPLPKGGSAHRFKRRSTHDGRNSLANLDSHKSGLVGADD